MAGNNCEDERSIFIDLDNGSFRTPSQKAKEGGKKKKRSMHSTALLSSRSSIFLYELYYPCKLQYRRRAVSKCTYILQKTINEIASTLHSQWRWNFMDVDGGNVPFFNSISLHFTFEFLLSISLIKII